MSLTEFHIDCEGDFSKLKNAEHSTQSRSAATVEPPHVFRDFYLMAFGHGLSGNTVPGRAQRGANISFVERGGSSRRAESVTC